MDMYFQLYSDTFIFLPNGENLYELDLSLYGKVKTSSIVVYPIKAGKKYCLKFIYPETLTYLPIADVYTNYRVIHVQKTYRASSNMTMNSICAILNSYGIEVETSKGYIQSVYREQINYNGHYIERTFFPIKKYGTNDYLLQKIYIHDLFNYNLDEDLSKFCKDLLHLKCLPKKIYESTHPNTSKRLLGHID